MFYFFWRSITGSASSAGGVWALILGSIAALVYFFLGDLIDADGFGISRLISGCVDIIVLPALTPFFVYLLLLLFRAVTGTADFTGFALLWLIPGAVVRALGWSSLRDPVLLVLVPVLWTAIAVGLSFLIRLIQSGRVLVIIPASLGILIIPTAAACSYWAFYAHNNTYGFIFLSAASAAALVSVIISFFRAEK